MTAASRVPPSAAHGAPPSARAPGSGRLRELRAIAHLLGPHRRQALVGVAATVAGSLVYLTTPYLTKVLVDQGVQAGSRGVVVGCAVASLALAVASWALRAVRIGGLNDAANAVVVTLQSRLFHHLQTLDLGYHEEHPVGETLSRLTNDVIATKALFTSGLPTLLKGLVSIVGAMAIMLVIDLDMALITLLVVPVLALMSWAYRRVAAPRFLAMRDTIAGVTTSANDSLAVVDVVQAFNQTERQQADFAGATQADRDAEYRTIEANAVYYPATTLLSATGAGLLVCYGGTQVVRGASEVGTMVAFFGYLSMFLAPLVSFSDLFRTYQAGIAAVDKVFTVLAEPPAAEARDLDRLPPGPGRVVISRVRLPVDGPPTARLDLDVGAGSLVAVAGEAGSGHRFVGRLLADLLPAEGGVVAIDGTDVRRVRQAALYEEVGYVGGDATLFDASVRENLTLGLDDRSDDELVATLGELFGTDRPLAGLVAGLDTRVGREGRKLPVGVRRRLVIARALLRRPRLLVLDGVTDALDPHSLLELARLHAHRPGLTVVAVTSQPLIARHADRVVVLAGGQVVEDGTHDELVGAGGEYARLHRSWVRGTAG